MRKASRRFDVFVIGKDDIERLSAWKSQDEVRFTYAESRSLHRVRKRNTFLFDALADIIGVPYRVSEGVLEDALYEVVMVDFHMNGHVRCDNPTDQNMPKILPAEALYEHGFHITGPDGQDIHFVPFIASASMAREEAYLFVNRKRLDGLLRAVSLDMVSEDPKLPVPVLNGEPIGQAEDAVFGGLMPEAKVASVPKLAAYMGLSLSDGVSLRECWAAAQTGELPELNDEQWAAEWMLGLNEHNTVCVGEWTDAPMHLDKFDYCWINKEAPRKAAELPSTRSQQSETQKMLSELFELLTDPEKAQRDKDAGQEERRKEFDQLLNGKGAELVAHWKHALDQFFVRGRRLKEPLSRIPVPRTSKQGVSLYSYALIYAMCLYQTEGCFIVVPDGETADEQDLNGTAGVEAATDDTGAADAAGITVNAGETGEATDAASDATENEEGTCAGRVYRADQLTDKPIREVSCIELKNKLDELLTDEGLRNRLWNLLREKNPTEQRVYEARPAKRGMRIALDKRPCARFRATLRKVEDKVTDRFSHGNLYDGCGFMEGTLFDKLQEKLLGRARVKGEEPLNAVQIRLPWCKGLLVRFDAAAFFKDWATEHGIEVKDLKICDEFGTLRSVCDENGEPVLKAVFTTAMFKGAGWFRKLEETGGQAADENAQPQGAADQPVRRPGDRWAEYWRRLRAHRASLLIAGRSTPPRMKSRLNYQFLSTLGLKEEELFELVEMRLRELGEAQLGVEPYQSKGRGKKEKEEAPAVAEPAGPAPEVSPEPVVAVPDEPEKKKEAKPLAEEDVKAELARRAGVMKMAGLLMSLGEKQSEIDIREKLMASAGDQDDDDPLGQLVNNMTNGTAENASADEVETHDFLTRLGKALVKHPERLVSTEIVHSRFNKLVHSEVLQLMRGRLPVHGDVRYLLPDLLQMVEYMAEHFLRDKKGLHQKARKPKDQDGTPEGQDGTPEGQDGTPEGQDEKQKRRYGTLAGINSLDGASRYGYYYAPGENVPWVRKHPVSSKDAPKEQEAGAQKETLERLDVAILRNPHYAMGEEPVVSPLPEKIAERYDRWFSHLTGCVMTSAAVMYTINGADCDGDRVNVCADTRIIKAIRRRALQESTLLEMVIRNREALLAWLKQQVNDEKESDAVLKYLALLVQELPEILPDCIVKTSGRKKKDFFPPLIYTGSTAKGALYSRNEMHDQKLKEKLWDSFCMSRKQRIGQMSLELLQLTSDAYKALPDIGGTPAAEATAGSVKNDAKQKAEPQSEVAGKEKLLLGLFLARYLVVCKALDTAMEIDMAKTGLSCDKHEIKDMSSTVYRYFGHHRESGYHAWLRTYRKYEKRLNGFNFDKALEEMMREFNDAWKKPADGTAVMDRLPAMVYALWAPQEAPKINKGWTIPERRKDKKEFYRVQQSNLMSNSGGQIRARLRKPDKEWIKRLEQPNADGQKLLDQIRDVVIDYDKRRRASANGQDALENISVAYMAVMEWLIRNGRGLDEALQDMSQLQAMTAHWYSSAGAHIRDVCVRMQDILKRQDVGVSWGWGDAAKRRELLDNARHEACAQVDAALERDIHINEEAYRILTCGRRSQVLVCHVLMYAWYDAVLREQLDAGCAMPAEELEARIRDVIHNAMPAGELPEDPEEAKKQQAQQMKKELETYYAACYTLYATEYTDGTGRDRKMMSEFLMTFLLRDMLDRMIVDTAR